VIWQISVTADSGKIISMLILNHFNT